MTKEEKNAIAQMNRALAKLNKVGIEICGMDNDLLYATKLALKDADRDEAQGDSYCEVAIVNRFGETEETGTFKAPCYQDSGGW